ncbi:hypothetical protein CIB84_002878 [Bambusicola thoracicus]|uniref:Uncharacterized protein n=1 Tax=Bambusicola thoracicus TaxID=9083 RepID=A0A2P4TAH1_BAMTH|nr:hypothetical protein CIB84_002878 [Bambusicola thoracicus]
MQMTQEHRGTWEPTQFKQNKRLGLLLLLVLPFCFLPAESLALLPAHNRSQLMLGVGLNPRF